MGSTLNAALFYASLGWPIIPVWSVTVDEDGHARCHCGNEKCNSPGKHPVSYFRGVATCPNGIKDATTDPGIIQEWWSRYPGANIGAAGTQWFALDIDRDEARFELAGKIPDTVESISGSGGQHILFRQPEDWKVGNGTGALPHGIDVRGCSADGTPRGYIILPPSMHPSGNRYEWEVSSHPRDVAIAEAPEWLLETIGKRHAGADVEIEEIDAPDLAVFEISKVTRNRILNGHAENEDWSAKDMAVCCALVEASASPSDIAAIFHKYPIGTEGKMSRHNSPDSYLETTIKSAFGWTTAKIPKKTIPSKVQPNEMVTEEEAQHEDLALNLAYLQGCADTLEQNVGVVPTLWPGFLELRKETYVEYGIGMDLDHKVPGYDDHVAGALVIPYYISEEVDTVEYNVYKPPADYPERFWKTHSGTTIFDTDLLRSMPVTGHVIVVADFDEALYLKEKGLLGYDILSQAGEGLAGGPRRRTKQLAEMLSDAERIVLLWPEERRMEGRLLASKLADGKQRVRWASMPASLRRMLTVHEMDMSILNRILLMASSVVA